MSSRLPLVSGFYQLLAVCLRLCQEVDYFKVSGWGWEPATQASLPHPPAAQGLSVGESVGDAVSMETDGGSRQVCLILFWKFVREVRVITPTLCSWDSPHSRPVK